MWKHKDFLSSHPQFHVSNHWPPFISVAISLNIISDALSSHTIPLFVWWGQNKNIDKRVQNWANQA